MVEENRSGGRRTKFSEQRMHIFGDEYFDSQFLRALTHQTYGGAEVGECFLAAGRIKNGDFESWTRAWRDLADSVRMMAEKCLASHHRVSAREAFLRASNYYRCAEFLIAPGRSLHREMWQKSRKCFQSAGALFDPAIEPISIPFQGYRLPGYFVPAAVGDEKCPTVIVFGGGDSSGEELYFYLGEGARRRGYHALLVEGPGQRGALHTNPGLVFRHDYEVPVRSVVDYALSRPEIDPDRLALYGLSLGGYIAVRSAAFEGRIKACVANPPYLDFSLAMKKGLPGWIQRLPTGTMDSVLNAVSKVSPMVRFALGTFYWILGVSAPSEIFSVLQEYSISGFEDRIRCPTLFVIGEGEGDEVLRQGHQLYERLDNDKTLRVTTLEEGGDAHCVSNNLSLMNQIVFDWLDKVLLESTKNVK